MAKITYGNPIFQSPYVYLQAAGSDGTDNTAAGIHLKWDFLRTLGANHLPKGNNTSLTPYATSSGFNNTTDYVKLYRVKHSMNFYLEWNSGSGCTKSNSTGKWIWEYQVPIHNAGVGDESTVQLIFHNTAAYNTLAASTAPAGNEGTFIAYYEGVMEIKVVDKPFFYCEFLCSKKDGGQPFYLRAEAIGIPDRLEMQERQLNVRKKFTDPTQPMKFLSENTDSVRFDVPNKNGLIIKIITYEDYFRGVNADYEREDSSADWYVVGTHFALSWQDSDMQNRLLESHIDGIYGHWPKFNDLNNSARFKVNGQNYVERWRRPGYSFTTPTDTSNSDPNGLQHFIHTYLENSVTDTKAIVNFASDDPSDDTVQTMSCLDMLRLVSLDFHVSRVLGMGHIDLEEELDTDLYVYCIEYTTNAGLDSSYSSSETRNHFYMSLPTAMSDYRLPVSPQLDDCTFGATVENGTDTPTQLTDINGYAPQENMRFININRKAYQHEKAVGPFFSDSTEFILANESQPVAYGLEYKEYSESGYRAPELSHDPDYLDRAEIPETMPILDNGGPRLFTHQEEEEGTHVYAAYAINWFSRISPLSNTKEVTTEFPKISRMLPPFNYTTQLIQDEDPSENVIADKVLVLTTQAEQEQLEDIPDGQDKTLVRTSFDWNHVHNHAHTSVDYAEFFFREEEPVVVKGKINTVTQINDDQAIVTTTSYSVNSSFPPVLVSPNIEPADSSRFVGSLLSCGDAHYFIEEVQDTGSNPSFLVRVLKQTQPMAPVGGNQNQFLSIESVEMPQAGDLFFVIENMSDASNWDLRHGTRIYLEKHYSNTSIGLRYSPTLVVNYKINNVSLVGVNTIIYLHEALKSTVTSGVSVEYTVRKRIASFTSNSIRVLGNIASDLTLGKKIRVFGNEYNDKEYTVSSNATYNTGTNTTIIHVVEPISNTDLYDGVLRFTVSRALSSLNTGQNTVTISGDRYAEILPAIPTFITESDGSETRFDVGGIKTNMMFEPLLDVNGSGTGFIQVFGDTDFVAHPDSRVEWYKGTVRLPDVSGAIQVYPVSYIGNLTTTTTTNLTFVIQDPGFVPADPSIPLSADMYTIDLNDELPGNFHPGYRFYMRSSNGYHPVTGAPIVTEGVHFEEGSILPENGSPTSGNKQTLMSVRAYDVAQNLYSFLSTPSVLLAQQIIAPVSPAQPQGPLFATRPDVYGKSTYTFDTVVDTSNGRQPYAMVFYRAANDKILDTLYSKETQDLIFGAWSLLPENFRYDPGMWNVLLNGLHDSEGDFINYVTFEGEFQWPLPDNEDYFVPYQSPLPISETNPMGGYHKPFHESNSFALNESQTVYGKTIPAITLLKDAIQRSFIPLTEQPPVYAHLRSGKQTSAAKSEVRDTNGNLLDPIANDLYPMVRLWEEDGVYSARFTDYTLDGASTSLYFYCACEIDSKLKLSAPSPLLGPVRMVDAFAPEQPQVRKTLIRLRNDYQQLSSAVQFDLNPFIASERISKIAIYRCTDELDALSVRTMKLVNTIPFENVVLDDFNDVDFPLYGEQLYYRLVAIREVMEPTDVLNTQTLRLVEIPSKPSDIIKTSLADNVNPEAPDLTFVFGEVTPGTYVDVEILWSATCYNGTYALQKMNSSGNWNEVYKVKKATGAMQYPPLPGEFGYSSSLSLLLLREDEDEKPIYHRYRVVVENSSGLFNLVQKEFIVGESHLVQEDFGTIDLEDNSGSINI